MIKIINSFGMLKTCSACGTTENTKIIEIGNGGAGAQMVCLCDKCLDELKRKLEEVTL